MSQFKLKPNQAALILNVSPEGEVNVEAAFPEEMDKAGDLAAAICTAIGQKLAEDEKFQGEIITTIDDIED